MSPDPLPLIERGLAVFALSPGGRTPAAGWLHRCITTPAQLDSWPAGANIGVSCRASGVIGLDLDRHAGRGGRGDGVATFLALCADSGQPWPRTLTVSTARGGLHVYLRVTSGLESLPSSSWPGGGLGPGIDIRGPGTRSGGFLIGPGSVVHGREYTILRDVPIAPSPPWLTGRLLAATSGRP